KNLGLARGADIKSSTLQDLEAGKPLEYEALNGIIVKKGACLGVPTPYNFTLYALLTQLQSQKTSSVPHPIEAFSHQSKEG
ncbi:MAG: ketopantoate reductase family protein, partial [Candidatus Methylomirabilales bacterium]